jgi:hypothetical protein
MVYKTDEVLREGVTGQYHHKTLCNNELYGYRTDEVLREGVTGK